MPRPNGNAEKGRSTVDIGNPGDKGKLLRCVRCNGPLKDGDWVGFTPDSGAWEHDEERACERERAKRKEERKKWLTR